MDLVETGIDHKAIQWSKFQDEIFGGKTPPDTDTFAQADRRLSVSSSNVLEAAEKSIDQSPALDCLPTLFSATHLISQRERQRISIKWNTMRGCLSDAITHSITCGFVICTADLRIPPCLANPPIPSPLQWMSTKAKQHSLFHFV